MNKDLNFNQTENEMQIAKQIWKNMRMQIAKQIKRKVEDRREVII